jgi:hypothetical protein
MFPGLKSSFPFQKNARWCWKYFLTIQYPLFGFISWKVNWKFAAIP